MISLTAAQKALIMSSSVKKTWTFEVYSGDTLEGTIPTSKMVSGGFSIYEPLCSSSSLEIGSCEASVLKIKLADVDDYELKGKTLKLTLTALRGGITVTLDMGTFTVDSSESKNSGYYYSLVAYDGMTAFDVNVSDWYNSLFDNAKTYTIKQLRDALCEYLGVEQESATLPNDSASIEQTVTATSLTGRDVLKAICQLNGCFGHFSRQGKLNYVFLGDASAVTLAKGGDDHYKTSATHEDWTVKAYDCVKIIPDEVTSDADAAGGVYPAEGGENGLIISDNFLTYGMGDDALSSLAEGIYGKVAKHAYVVHSTPTKGRPWIEAGDQISIEVEKNGVTSTITSYVLERTLSGFQAMSDTFEAKGTEDAEDTAVSSNIQFTQLKSLTSLLTRTVEKLSLELSSLDYVTSDDLGDYATKNSLSAYLTADSLATELTKYSYITADDLSDYVTAEKLSLYATSSELSAYAEKVNGNDSQTFGYSLTADGFTLTANGESVFYCDESGITVNGTIYAENGTIGNFVLADGVLTSGSKKAYSDTNAGVYIGTDGIGLGKGTFYVEADGTGLIGGFTLAEATMTAYINDKERLVLNAENGQITFYDGATSSSYKSDSAVQSYANLDYQGLGSVWRTANTTGDAEVELGADQFPYVALDCYARGGLYINYWVNEDSDATTGELSSSLQVWLDSDNSFAPTIYADPKLYIGAADEIFITAPSIQLGDIVQITSSLITAGTSIIPNTASSYSLGSYEAPWASVYGESVCQMSGGRMTKVSAPYKLALTASPAPYVNTANTASGGTYSETGTLTTSVIKCGELLRLICMEWTGSIDGDRWFKVDLSEAEYYNDAANSNQAVIGKIYSVQVTGRSSSGASLSNNNYNGGYTVYISGTTLYIGQDTNQSNDGFYIFVVGMVS